MAVLLDFVEAIGIQKWQPSVLGLDELLSLLEQDIDPARTHQTAVATIIERSGDWLDEIGFLESWFEEGAEVDAILSKNPRSKIPTKVAAIIKSILEPHRTKWIERFLWTALWLKQKQDLLSPWADFFIIGRELHRGRPVNAIPVMRGIAEATVRAGMMRS